MILIKIKDYFVPLTSCNYFKIDRSNNSVAFRFHNKEYLVIDLADDDVTMIDEQIKETLRGLSSKTSTVYYRCSSYLIE